MPDPLLDLEIKLPKPLDPENAAAIRDQVAHHSDRLLAAGLATVKVAHESGLQEGRAAGWREGWLAGHKEGRAGGRAQGKATAAELAAQVAILGAALTDRDRGADGK